MLTMYRLIISTITAIQYESNAIRYAKVTCLNSPGCRLIYFRS